jgi:hypothetical protein
MIIVNLLCYNHASGHQCYLLLFAAKATRVEPTQTNTSSCMIVSWVEITKHKTSDMLEYFFFFKKNCLDSWSTFVLRKGGSSVYWILFVHIIFFLKHAGELCINILRRKKERGSRAPYRSPAHTHNRNKTHTPSKIMTLTNWLCIMDVCSTRFSLGTAWDNW